jgi:hypothetical protein
MAARLTEVKSALHGLATAAANDNTNQIFSTDSFWEFSELDDISGNWGSLAPYQLLILQRKEGDWLPSEDGEKFTLPIPPQTLNRSTPFAITTSATLGGIIEEHNGAPIRTISLSGTTGVLPLRGITEQPFKFGSTLGAVAGIVKDSINDAFGADSVEAPNLNHNRDFESNGDTELKNSTGFMQWMLLERFLESYVNMKKTAAGKNKALAFAIWKEEAVYLVTPVSFNTNRSAQNPLEYMYDLQFKAWKRITLGISNSGLTFKVAPVARSQSRLSKILNTIQKGRTILENAKKELKDLRADIQLTIFSPLRQAVLFLKDLNSTGMTLADFPEDVVKDLKEATLEKIGAGDLLLQGRDARTDPKIQAALHDLKKMAQTELKGTVQSGRQAALHFSPPLRKYGSKSPATANKIFDKSGEHYDLMNKVSLNDLNLRPATIRRIEDERRKVRLLKREDFEKTRDDILNLLAQFSDKVGAGNATYNSIYGIQTTANTKVASDNDWDVIHALSQVAQGLDSMAASSTINRDEIDTMSYIAGLATRSGIAFRVPRSKFLVPFLYGYTLEKLSNQYLGTPDRWMEIAALNGLQEPYVDEVGFNQSILANGSGLQLTVADGTHYYVNQSVWIRSNTQRQEQRRITNVNKLSPNMTVLTLNGTSDLNKFTTLAQTQVYAFLPNTVNSRQYIYIPSDEPTEDDFRVKGIPGVDYFDPLVRTGGIDLLLSPEGDLVITPEGTTRLAVGMANLIQKVRIALGTPRGGLLRHPSFGLGIKPGSSTADISASELQSQAKSMFRDDPAFTGVNYAAVLKSGNSVKMTISIGIAGVNRNIPITVEVRR